MAKVQSYVMLILPNVIIESSNVKKRKEKKKREPLNVTKVQSHVILVLPNVIMKSLNVRKNKGTIECDKNTVTYNVGIA